MGDFNAAFKYLGDWVHEQGGLDQEIRARVQGIGAAWNNVSGVMYDRRMPARLLRSRSTRRWSGLQPSMDLRRGS